ncbi:MAG: hypothetical protein JNK67_23220 [Alphaproteobacteria bacterium]|nr:hypothetical protein [Alphaproteobacteria bacterium]
MDLSDAIPSESPVIDSISTGDPPARGESIEAFDRMVGLLALSRVRISLVAIELADTPARVAREAALAACGATGFLIPLAPQRFVILDVGPRGASPRADQAIAERVRALAMAALSARCDPRRARLRSAELHLCSDQVGSATLRLAQLARMLAAATFDRHPLGPQEQKRRDKPDRLSLVA